MLFWLDIDGYRVAVQAVKRGNTAYWRLAPYTIIYPTPRQREVRNTLMVGAHSGVAMSAYAVNKKVQQAFAGWDYAEKPKNKTEAAMQEIYGNEANIVLEYIDKIKHAGEIINSNSELKNKIQKRAEILLNGR